MNACDVKDIQNTPLGVPGFWMRAMLNHSGIARLIQEKDRPILMHLQDIQCDLHTTGYGFDLTFTFEKNDYFKNAQLKKAFVMTRQNIIEKCEGTEIEWKDGKDVTKKKIKKKQKHKKTNETRTIVKTVEAESFFNVFTSRTAPDEGADLDEEEENELREKIDVAMNLAEDIDDVLIPDALEYYLGLNDDLFGAEDGADEDGDDGSDEDKSDDEGDSKKKKSKGGDKKPEGGAPAGGEQKQECKQQ